MEARIDEVLEILSDCFEAEIHWWENEDSRNIEDLSDDDEIYLEIHFKTDKCFITEFNNYNCGFPKRFLKMKNKQIKKELLDEIKRSEEKKADKREKQKTYYQKRKVLNQRLKEAERKLKDELGIR